LLFAVWRNEPTRHLDEALGEEDCEANGDGDEASEVGGRFAVVAVRRFVAVAEAKVELRRHGPDEA
jgi:hypothetical protein